MSIFQELKRYCQYKQVCFDPAIMSEKCACSYTADTNKTFIDMPKCEEGNCPFIKVINGTKEDEESKYPCSCYEEVDSLHARCNGTKERDFCSCGGDESKCDFYPEKRVKTEETDPTDPCAVSKVIIDFALEKQEKKKVEITSFYGVTYDACPSCKANIFGISKPNFCPWCGQHLDWGSEE